MSKCQLLLIILKWIFPCIFVHLWLSFEWDVGAGARRWEGRATPRTGRQFITGMKELRSFAEVLALMRDNRKLSICFLFSSSILVIWANQLHPSGGVCVFVCVCVCVCVCVECLLIASQIHKFEFLMITTCLDVNVSTVEEWHQFPFGTSNNRFFNTFVLLFFRSIFT